MERANPVIICDYAYYLSQNYPGINYKICQVNKQFFICFADSLLRNFTKKHYANETSSYDKLQFINKMYRTNFKSLTVEQKKEMLTYGAMYDLLYPFQHIRPEEVDSDGYDPEHQQLEVTRDLNQPLVTMRDIDPSQPNRTITPGENGYFFNFGLLLLVAIKYNSQKVAEFLIENNGYTIDVNEVRQEYPYRRYLILNNVATLYEQPDHPLLRLAKINISKDGREMELEEYEGSAFDYTAFLGNLSMLKMITDGEDLSHYDNTLALYYATLNRDIALINYLLDHCISLERGARNLILRHIFEAEGDYADMVEYIIYYMYQHKISYYIDDRKITPNITENIMDSILEDFTPVVDDREARIVKLIKTLQDRRLTQLAMAKYY